MFPRLLVTTVFAVSTTPAFAWNALGHKVVSLPGVSCDRMNASRLLIRFAAIPGLMRTLLRRWRMMQRRGIRPRRIIGSFCMRPLCRISLVISNGNLEGPDDPKIRFYQTIKELERRLADPNVKRRINSKSSQMNIRSLRRLTAHHLTGR